MAFSLQLILSHAYYYYYYLTDNFQVAPTPATNSYFRGLYLVAALSASDVYAYDSH